MWLDAYVQLTLMRQRMADAEKRAARYRLLYPPTETRDPRRVRDVLARLLGALALPRPRPPLRPATKS